MDFLYSQLPEIVYDPADLTGISTNGTVQISIDNNKRIIEANVLKTPGKLIINDPNTNSSYEYNGSIDTLVNFPVFEDSLDVIYREASAEEKKDGISGFLEVTLASGKKIICPIPYPVASSDIQKITSINTIYVEENLPTDAEIGSIYPVSDFSAKAIWLYEKTESGYVKKDVVKAGTIYVVMDIGLFALAKTNFKFVVLNGALNTKQDILTFADEYNKETNKVATEETVNKKYFEITDNFNTTVETINQNVSQNSNAINNLTSLVGSTNNQVEESKSKIEELENEVGFLDNRIDNANNAINNLTSLVGSTRIEKIEATGNFSENDKAIYRQTFKDGSYIDFELDDSSQWYLGEEEPLNNNNYSLYDCYLNSLTGDVYQFLNNNSVKEWVYKGNIKGPVGNTGEQGKKGDKGDTGYIALETKFSPKETQTPDYWGTHNFIFGYDQFNREPLIGDNFLSSYECTTNGLSYICTWTVVEVDDSAKCKITQFIINTGKQGPDGQIALQFNSELLANSTPAIGNLFYQISIDSFNRNPVLGDVFFSVIKYNENTYLALLQVDEVFDNYITSHIVSVNNVTGKKGDTGEPLKVTKLYNSIEDMNSDIDNIPEGAFVIAQNTISNEVTSELYCKIDEDFKLIINFKDTLVPNGLVVTKDGLLKLAVNGEGINEGVILPATGAKGLDSESNDDGTVTIWLIDDGGAQLGNSITVAASGGGGGSGSAYSYRVVNLLDSVSFNATTAEESIILKFKCQEKESGELVSGTTSKVLIEYSTDKSIYKELATIEALNDVDTTFEYKISDLKEGINYIRLTCTAGTAEDLSGNKLVKTLTYTITVINCKVVTTLDKLKTYNSNITVPYSCIGAGLDKTSHIKVTKADEKGNIITYWDQSEYYGASSSSNGSYKTYTIDTSKFEHGVYNLDLYYTYLDNNGLTRESAHIRYDIMFSTELNYPLLGAYLNNTTVTYGDEVTTTYVAYTPDNAGVTSQVKRSIYQLIDGEKNYIYSTVDENVTNNIEHSWPINFGAVGFPISGTLYIEFDTLTGANKVFEVTVKPLAGVENIILHDTLKIAYIAPTGQMNSASNSDSLDVDFTDQQGTKTTIQVEMVDFNYTSNGFLQDNTTNIVRISGDARLRIHLPLFANNYYDSEGNYVQLMPKNTSGRTAEFRFKVSNITNANTSVIDFLNETSITSEKLEGSGFRVQPKQAFIIDSSTPIEYDYDGNVKYPQSVAVTHFCENEIIRLSFVVEPHNKDNKQSLRIYTNGELTRIIPYSQSVELNGPTYIELGSNDCVLDLYSAVFYQKALSESDILQNYLADIPSIPKRIEEYNLNNVQNDSGQRTNPDYKFTDSEGNEKDLSRNFDNMLLYSECTKRVPCILTTGPMSSVKGDKTKVGAIYTKPGDDGEVITIFSSSGECQTNVQGTTSSKLYPRYNYKITTKNEAGKKVKLYLIKNSKGVVEIMNKDEAPEGAIGESTLCWKADVMSPDHANTVNATWFEDFFNEKFPPQKENKFTHSTVWGCRCLLFNRLTEDGEITFMGDGCLNNDKSNADTFGLTANCDTDASDSYWSNSGVVVNNYAVEESGEVVAVKNSEGDIETKCQKWEFLDNGPNICNFYDDLFFKKDAKGDYAVLEALESTFPDQGDLEDYNLTPNYGHIQILYLWLLKRANFWTAPEEITETFKQTHECTFKNSKYYIPYNGVEYETEKAYRKAIFENEFQLHFNLDHTTAYFIAVTITALVDNYAKNLFLACYDTMADKITFTDSANQAGVNSIHTMINYAIAMNGNIPEDFIDWGNSSFAIWYPTLYDLDSCYGVDNKGYKWIPYYADWDYVKWGDTIENGGSYIMNGNQSYFWRMFYEVYYNNIKSKYQNLAEKGTLTLSKWKDLMINKNIDTVPVSITTEDSIFKYAMPWWYGYTKDNYTNYSETPDFLYLIQANKKLQDLDFMTQRFNMYNSEFEVGNYTNDKITVLLPTGAEGEVSFNITPIQDMWCGVQFATQANITKAVEKTKAGETTTITGNKTSEDTITIYGASLLQEITGLDNLYGTTYNLDNAVNIRKLKIGNDSKINNNTTSLNIQNCSMLEELDIINCAGISSIDITQNGLIKKIVAKNSGLNSLSLPNGGYLEELYLPPLQNLTIRNQENLRVFQMGDYSEDEYIPNNNKLTTLYIEGNMPVIPLAEIIEDSLDTLTGIRLTNVYLDISSWDDYDRVKAFISLLTSDTLKNTQLDINGNKIEANDNDISTWYPIISGTLKVNNNIVDDDLDLLLTRIVERYPTLYIQQPDNRKPLGDCWWYEIAAVCAAAKNGTLTDGGVPCDIKRSLQEDGTYSGWWAEGNKKSLTMKDNTSLSLTIAGFWQEKDPNGKLIPLSFITDVAYPTYYRDTNGNIWGSYYFDSKSKFLYGVSIDGVNCSPEEGSSIIQFKYEGEKKDITIEFTDRTYLKSIICDSSGYQWFFNGWRSESDPAGAPYSNMHLSQEDILGSSYVSQLPDVKFNGYLEWLPGGDIDKKLIIDATEGDIHIYNKSVYTTMQYYRDVEFKKGAKIIIPKVTSGSTIQINLGDNRYASQGYWYTTIREFVEGDDVWGQFPETFKNIVKTSRVYANIGGLSSDVEFKDVKIYLPSVNDLGFERTELAYENETLSTNSLTLFVDDDSRRGEISQRAYPWWTRSANEQRKDQAMAVTSGGGLTNSSANYIKNTLITRFNV